MYNNKKILAIIPARSGSKRLPGKNLKDLAGKPLIVWTIESALHSKYIDKLIVSTDSDEIANTAKQYGVEVPFMRPDELASDEASSIDVIKHALTFYQDEFDHVLFLQPTSPLRQTTDIDSVIKQMDDSVKAVVSVCETEHSPLWSNTLPEDLYMKNFIRPEIKNKRSQDLPKYYRLNGAVYIAEIKYFMENNGFLGKQTKAYIMPLDRSVDVDTEMDLNIVRTVILKKRNDV